MEQTKPKAEHHERLDVGEQSSKSIPIKYYIMGRVIGHIEIVSSEMLSRHEIVDLIWSFVPNSEVSEAVSKYWKWALYSALWTGPAKETVFVQNRPYTRVIYRMIGSFASKIIKNGKGTPFNNETKMNYGQDIKNPKVAYFSCKFSTRIGFQEADKIQGKLPLQVIKPYYIKGTPEK